MRLSVFLKSVLCAVVFLSLFSPYSCHATIQDAEQLEYNGKIYFISPFPLSELDPLPNFDVERTSNYRGYMGCWKIEKDVLYLVSLEATILGNKVRPEDVFPGQTSFPIKADWFSGAIELFDQDTYNQYYMDLLTGESSDTLEPAYIFDVEQGSIVKFIEDPQRGQKPEGSVPGRRM
jgi:hypothetical protein